MKLILLFILELNILFKQIISDENLTTIIIPRITASADPATSGTTQKAQEAAIDEINNNSNILPNYVLKLKVFESNGESEKALEHAITISQIFSQCSMYDGGLISPIIMGCPWSSFSVLTARVFNIYHLLQISSSATSPTLSGDDYHSFFRTIANDILQGKALIQICKQFAWNRIAVIHLNDNYGQNLNKVIEEEGAEENITVSSKSFINNDIDSIYKAAEFIKNNKLYITILVAQASDAYYFFQKMKQLNAIQYPYFFIGVDSWFDEGEIESDIIRNTNDLTNYITGFIGTTPGYPAMFTKDEYKQYNIYQGNMTIYEISKQKFDNLLNKMKDFDLPITSTVMSTSYDALYSLAYAFDTYERQNGINSLKTQLSNCYNLSNVSKKIRKILINMPEFIGITGPVKFDKYGDRINGMFVYGNIANNGKIKYIGDFSHVNDSIEYILNNSINWTLNSPHKPWSDIKRIAQINGINIQSICIVGFIYFIICLLAIYLLYRKNNTKGYVAVRLDMSITFGLILCFIFIISYGIQKFTNIHSNKYQLIYDGGCVSNSIILCIAFTFTFLAFITSNSESMRVIIKITNQQIGQYNEDKYTDIVSKKILKCLFADLTIIIGWIITYFIVYFVSNVKLLEYVFVKVSETFDSNDVLLMIEKQYPICSTHWSTNIFYAILLLYKICQMVYAMNNDSMIVMYIILIVCIALIGLIALIWYILDQTLLDGQIDINIQYYILSLTIIFIYLLWIVPEYVMLCRKSLEPTENTKPETSTTSPQYTTTTPQDTTITGFNHSHIENSSKQI